MTTFEANGTSVTVNGKEYKVKTTKEGVTLDLQRKKITDISQIEGLPALTNLQSLDLNSNQIREIKGLDTLANLQSLNLNGNQISEIKGLDALANLQGLYLASNKISEIKGLGALANLRELYLSVNPISEIKGLDTLVNLRELELAATKISEVKGLENLAQLTYLNFSDSPVFKWVDKQWGHNDKMDVKRVQEAVAYCQRQVAPLRAAEKERQQQQAAMEPARLEKLKKLVRVSKSLTVSQMAQILSLTEKELYERIVDWADQFGFSLDKDTVEFGAGRKDDFIASLDKEFESWGKKDITKEGKI